MTKKEKYDVITKVLSQIESGEDLFICPAIEFIIGGDKLAHKYIPELLEYKPKDKKPAYTWWRTDPDGKNERIRVLKELQNRFKNN